MRQWRLISKIDGTDTRQDKIYQRNRVEIPTAERDIQTIEIKGRNGSLTKEYGFKDILLPVEYFFYEKEEFEPYFRRFKQRLLNAKTLIVNRDNGLFYKIKSAQIEVALSERDMLGEFTVNYTLDPFLYEISNAPQTITSRTVITNEGYETQPIITATCSGTGKIYVNDVPIVIQNINGTITINSEMMNAYRKVGALVTNLNSHMVGDFPVLRHGDNVIDFDGDISKLELIKNKRWL
ncbi:hypothetical protein AB4Y30_11430 [Ornithinibacillus sp. 4-3]|uniref:Phage tail protein n=1 Tax=Ornithinibacillus sp. 4-3 TaxID=3231488 RepID=A0AB39HIB7_9BACI